MSFLLVNLLMNLFTTRVDVSAQTPHTQFAASDNLAAPEAYDANNISGKRRKTIWGSNRPEDELLRSQGRKRIAGNARDLTRNFAVTAWAVRRHLDYVTQFSFHGRTTDKGFNDALELYVERVCRPAYFDAAGRHDRGSVTRLLETHAVLDGDVGLMKLADNTVQGIESDRVKDPLDTSNGKWVQGIKVNPAGRALAYSIHRRESGGLAFERVIPASNMLWHGYYSRFDQVRGVSPITSSLNLFRDVYENFDYALAKAKVSQIFAMAIMRDADESFGDVQGNEQGEEGEGEEEAKSRYNLDLAGGPMLLDMDPGDKLEFLTANHPSNEFQAFTTLCTMAALKGLDIPFSFYDESHTNFFGSRGAWLHYERSCKHKRDNLAWLLDRWTYWRLTNAILDGDFQMSSGKNLDDIDWEWVPRGMPWWDQAKEIRGDLMAIAAGLDYPQRICHERDRGDFFHNVDKIAEALKYAQEQGVTLSFDPGQAPVEVVNNAGN